MAKEEKVVCICCLQEKTMSECSMVNFDCDREPTGDKLECRYNHICPECREKRKECNGDNK